LGRRESGGEGGVRTEKERKREVNERERGILKSFELNLTIRTEVK